jgi:SET domain-containing protein
MNHSCSPNAGMRIIGKTVLFYALSSVKRGDELTCDYEDTHHDGRRACQCGSGKSRGSI